MLRESDAMGLLDFARNGIFLVTFKPSRQLAHHFRAECFAIGATAHLCL